MKVTGWFPRPGARIPRAAISVARRDQADRYGAPPGWLGRAVAVQWNASYVRLLDPTTGQLLREHRRQATRGHHRIHPDDQSTRTPLTTVTLLARAARAGTHIGTLCAGIHRRDGELGVRRILGVLGLVKKHGAGTVDAACAAALELAVADYRFVRRYLERHPTTPPPGRSAHSWPPAPPQRERSGTAIGSLTIRRNGRRRGVPPSPAILVVCCPRHLQSA